MNKLKEYPPTRQRNGVNGPLAGLWYPPSRPQQFSRLTGKTSNPIDELNGTFWTFRDTIVAVQGRTFMYDGAPVQLVPGDQISFELLGQTFRMISYGNDISWSVSDGSSVVWGNVNSVDIPCQVPPTFVKQYKMLGKTAAGVLAQTDCAPQRSIISFSGRAAIRPPVATPSKKFYADTAQYLKSRGNTYLAKSVIHKVPEVQYADAGAIVWPVTPQPVAGYDFPLNSAWFQGCGAEKEACNLTVYKPSNYKYAVQGAVSSGARLDRIKLALVTDKPKKFHNKKCCKFAR
jgi:hypothetical protein